MEYLSVASGIEAATVAWHGLGWKPVGFSEIDPFACAVLNHHYPDIPNLGNMNTIHEKKEFAAHFDVLVGGTPCQSFSVAGLRKGLDDPRGNLSLVYLSILQRKRPTWFIWENVTGVLSSSDGKDFYSLLAGFSQLGYGWAYRVLDAQYFGVAQRRRRVFVVGYYGDWRRAAAVLFDSKSLRWDSPPSREERESPANTVASTIRASRSPRHKGERTDNIIPWPKPVVDSLDASFATKHGQNDQHIKQGAPFFIPAWWNGDQIAQTLDRSLIGKGQTMPEKNRFAAIIVPFDTTQITSPQNRSIPKDGDPMHPLAKNAHPPAIAYSGDGLGLGIRRLTPIECERLQGFPDNYTRIPFRGKSEEKCPDSHRYMTLGNTMAVPVMAWLGKRIQMVEDIVKC